MDDNIKFLQQELTRLNQEIAEVRAEAKKHRIAKKRLAEENNSLKGAVEERDRLKAQLEAEPSALQAELDRLKGEVRTRDHREAFTQIANDLKVRPEGINDLWSLSGYKAETDVPDPGQIKAVLSEAVKARPYLLAEQPQEEQPKTLSPGPGFARGAADNANFFVVRKSEMQDCAFMMKNQAKVSEASRAGNLKIIE